MASETIITTDHQIIKQWAEARGGKPAIIKGTRKDGDTGILRIDFPDYGGQDNLEEISWEAFFTKLDAKNLAFLCQEKTSSGEESRFFKLVSCNAADQKAAKGSI